MRIFQKLLSLDFPSHSVRVCVRERRLTKFREVQFESHSPPFLSFFFFFFFFFFFCLVYSVLKWKWRAFVFSVLLTSISYSIPPNLLSLPVCVCVFCPIATLNMTRVAIVPTADGIIIYIYVSRLTIVLITTLGLFGCGHVRNSVSRHSHNWWFHFFGLAPIVTHIIIYRDILNFH